MATMLDQRSSHLGLGYDTLRYAGPQFTNPWASTVGIAGNNASALYQTPATPASAPVQQHVSRNNSPSTYQPSSTPAQSLPQDAIAQARAIYGNGYGAHNSFAPSSTSRYPADQYSTASSYAAYEQAPPRASYPVKPPLMGRDSYNDALDASQGMVAMSQDITPRNVYAPRHGSQDSYGFPTHSTNSSISSASGYNHYYHGSYNGSVDGSVAGSSITDYSSEAENVIGTRSIPGTGFAAHFPPEQAQMMTQFNSKMSASAQKKHKCKICDKRFTRPSSLQTHMYSHTGEKPFACDFDGCGRHFSVVSNLRRHKKCHRNGTDRSSPDDDSMSHGGDL